MYTNIAVCYISLNFCCNRALHTDRLQGTAPVWLNRPEKPPPNQHSRGGGGGAAPWPGPPTAVPCEARGYRSAPSAARAGPGRAPPGEREGAPEGAPPCLQRGACPRSPPSRLRSTEAARPRPRPRPRPDPPLQVPRGLTAILRPPPAGPAAPSRSSARRRPPQVPLSARPQRFPPAEASPWGAGDVQQLLTGPVAAALGARLQRRLNGGEGRGGRGKGPRLSLPHNRRAARRERLKRSPPLLAPKPRREQLWHKKPRTASTGIGKEGNGAAARRGSSMEALGFIQAVTRPHRTPHNGRGSGARDNGCGAPTRRGRPWAPGGSAGPGASRGARRSRWAAVTVRCGQDVVCVTFEQLFIHRQPAVVAVASLKIATVVFSARLHTPISG